MKMSVILLAILLFNNSVVAMGDYISNRPIIAVLAQDAPPFYNRSYIAASYVKYLESSGARVVPVPSHMSDEQVEEIFHGVNGVLFPGGGVQWNISGYFKHAKYFFAKSLEANKNGDYFPIWGTCLGFETLNIIAAGNRPDILTKFSASDISIPLNYTDIAPESRLFKDMPQNLYKALGTEAISYNHHNYGVGPETYAEEPSLRNFFNVLSYNNGELGRTFVSSIECKKVFLYLLSLTLYLKFIFFYMIPFYSTIFQQWNTQFTERNGIRRKTTLSSTRIYNFHILPPPYKYHSICRISL